MKRNVAPWLLNVNQLPLSNFLTCSRRSSMSNKQEFDAAGFYSGLERAVRLRKVTWKDVSNETGVSQTTLTRMGQGRRPDAASLAALSAWAGINPADYVPRTFPHRQTEEQTLDKVAL